MHLTTLLPFDLCNKWKSIGWSVLLGLFVVGLFNGTQAQETQERPKTFEKLGTLDSPLIRESSGLAIAETQPDSFWTVNDSGHTNDVFCVSFSGQVLAQVTLRNASNVDWESMAWFVKDGVRYLVVADVGDNRSRRQQLQVYFFPEPEFERQSEMVKFAVDCWGFQFVYSDGPRDCEALAVDPLTLDIWMVEKVMRPRSDRQPPGLYRISASDRWLDKALNHRASETKANNVSDSPLLTAERVGDFPFLFVTGLNFSPAGNRLVMRNYFQAFLFEKPADQTWADTLLSSKPTTIRLPVQRQGEAIAFSSDAKSLIVTSEFENQPIWRIHLDKELDGSSPAAANETKDVDTKDNFP